VTLSLLVSCSAPKTINKTIFALDTVITIEISGDNDEALSVCSEMIETYENLFSRTIATGDVSRFNDSDDGITNPSVDTINLIEKALSIAENTYGTFNPALGTITPLWKDSIPETIDLSHIDYTQISINDKSILKSDSEIRFDLGAIAKGYICEKVTDYLISKNINYGVLSFGGNISVFGSQPNGEKWRIGIRDPYDTNDIAGNLLVDSGYISVSGDYQRYFEVNGKRYHHIIDTTNGYPADNGVSSVAVWCSDGTLADALSTALFVMGVDEGMKYHASGIYDFEVMFITKDGFTMSDGFRQNFVKKAT
jgi:Membrane-associated lipoprotein involved in thiamine biosynthesis